MLVATHEGNDSAVKALIKHGAKINERSREGDTPFLGAAGTAQGTAVLQLLIDAGADVHATDEHGWNGLMLAAWNHNSEAVRLLTDLGLDPCLMDPSGRLGIDFVEWNLNEDPGKQDLEAFFKKRCPHQTSSPIVK